MSKISKILLCIILSIIVFGLSAFAMYKYGKFKTFSNLTSQGDQYMLQKDYDKAIQTYQQALSYKNDSDVQTNIIVAQNLKNEDGRNSIISKNIQLASEAAKNNKYDEANKYLDEILKIDPNNSEAKSLKGSYAEVVQEQQEKAQAQAKSKQEAKITSANNSTGGITSKQAYNIAVNHFKDYDIFPEGESIEKSYFPSKIVNSYYLFYSEWKYDHSANDGLIGVNKITGNIVWIRPDGKIEN